MPANVPPSGYLFPVAQTRPPATRDCPGSERGCAAPFGLRGPSSQGVVGVLDPGSVFLLDLLARGDRLALCSGWPPSESPKLECPYWLSLLLGASRLRCPQDGRSPCSCLSGSAHPWGARLRGTFVRPSLPHRAHPASLRSHRNWWPTVALWRHSLSPGHANFAGTCVSLTRAALTRSGGRPYPG